MAHLIYRFTGLLPKTVASFVFVLTLFNGLFFSQCQNNPPTRTCDGGTLTGTLKTSIQVPKNKICYLQGFVTLAAGTEFRAEAGATIRARKYHPTTGRRIYTTLSVAPGAKIYSVGNSSNPVVFTSDPGEDNPAPGDWGGVALFGKGPLPLKNDGDSTEDITAIKYGGGRDTQSAANSGKIRYTRVEYGGMDFFHFAGFIGNVLAEILETRTNSQLNLTDRTIRLMTARLTRLLAKHRASNLAEIQTDNYAAIQEDLTAFYEGDEDRLEDCQARENNRPEDFTCVEIYGPAREIPGLDKLDANLWVGSQGVINLTEAGLENFDGLGLFGVGSGTVIEYVEIFASGDDGIKIKGGNVNLNHIVLHQNYRDQIEFKGAWRGSLQNTLILLREASPDKGAAISLSENSRLSAANLTIVADGNEYDEIANTEENSRLRLYNSLVAGFVENEFNFEGAATLDGIDKKDSLARGVLFEGNTLQDGYTAFQKGRLPLGQALDGQADASDSLGGNFRCDEDDPEYDEEKQRCDIHGEATWVAAFLSDSEDLSELANGSNLILTNLTLLESLTGSNFVPRQAADGFAFAPAGEFGRLAFQNYIGALPVQVDKDWTAGWTRFSAEQE